MITEKQRAERLRRHEELKGFYEAKLVLAGSEEDREHLEARIAEVEGDIAATTLSAPKDALPEITETIEEEATPPEDPEKKTLNHNGKTKKAQVGNPF